MRGNTFNDGTAIPALPFSNSIGFDPNLTKAHSRRSDWAASKRSGVVCFR
jgi:hypothetical protein